jgi:hypothetical protein
MGRSSREVENVTLSFIPVAACYDIYYIYYTKMF